MVSCCRARVVTYKCDHQSMCWTSLLLMALALLESVHSGERSEPEKPKRLRFLWLASVARIYGPQQREGHRQEASVGHTCLSFQPPVPPYVLVTA